MTTADQWRDKSVQNLRQRALDTGCWVVSADVVGRHGERVSHGCACVVRPDGSLAARVEEGGEGAAIVDID
jgi:predicted amidohydrolase